MAKFSKVKKITSHKYKTVCLPNASIMIIFIYWRKSNGTLDTHENIEVK